MSAGPPAGRRRRPRPAGERADAGMTLVDLLVASVLSAFLMAAGTAAFIGAMKATRGAGARTAASADLRIAMEQLSREIRVAIPATGAGLVDGTPTGLSFYALLDRSGSPVAADADVLPTLVRYRYDGSCLNVTLTPALDAAGSLDTARARTRCVLRTTTPPGFGYYSAPPPGGAADGTPLVSTGGLSAADLAATRSIEIRLTASTAAGAAPPARLLSRVALVNLGGEA